MVIALPLGALLGIARLSDHAWVRWPAGIVVEFFRADPGADPDGVRVQALWFAVFGRSEPVRSRWSSGWCSTTARCWPRSSGPASSSLPRGQTEAANAIGLRKAQTMTIILLPQAVTAMLPAVVSQLVVIVKDTALGGIFVGYVELRRAAGTSASNYGNLLPTYVVIAVIYILINLALGRLSTYLERKLSSRGGTRIVIGGGDGQTDLLQARQQVDGAGGAGLGDRDADPGRLLPVLTGRARRWRWRSVGRRSRSRSRSGSATGWSDDCSLSRSSAAWPPCSRISRPRARSWTRWSRLPASTVTSATPAAGWTIAHQIGHLNWTDRSAPLLACRTPRPVPPRPASAIVSGICRMPVDDRAPRPLVGLPHVRGAPSGGGRGREALLTALRPGRRPAPGCPGSGRRWGPAPWRRPGSWRPGRMAWTWRRGSEWTGAD